MKDYAGNDWRKVFDVNVNGVFYCNRAAVRAMDRAGYGRIVNVASVAGKEGNPNASAYSASKAAVIALTKSLGKETATTGIRVNCITPAAIKTALFDQMTPQHIEFMLSKIPVGRFGTIEEATSLVCWLASEECSFCHRGRIRSLRRPGHLLKGRPSNVRTANRSHEDVVSRKWLFDSRRNQEKRRRAHGGKQMMISRTETS